MLHRRHVLALPLAIPAIARAQSWPSQPIRLIVPFGAGGATDIFARMVADRIGPALGARVIVENRPGAGATIGAQAVARAVPDGHTLLVLTSSHTIGETLLPGRGYVLARDFVPVAAFNSTALAIVTSPSLPVSDMAGLIAHAKQNPGAVAYATTGIGTVNHLAAELIRLQAGFEWLHVPYRTGAEARSDMMAGRVPVMFDPVAGAVPLARERRANVLAVTTAARSAAMPEVPSVGETLPGFDVGLLIGLLAPAGTPEPIVQHLAGAVRAVTAAPDIASLWREQGAEPLTLSPEAWSALLAADPARWAQVVRDAGVTV
jgi:tripartite-type tricarboxylate transporter receptor subunit TctC